MAKNHLKQVITERTPGKKKLEQKSQKVRKSESQKVRMSECQNVRMSESQKVRKGQNGSSLRDGLRQFETV